MKNVITPNGEASSTPEPLSGSQIGMLREALGLNHADFAHRVSMSPKRLLLLESEEEVPTPEEAKTIRSLE